MTERPTQPIPPLTYQTAPPARQPRRGLFTASVVTASLLLGGAAGLASGAAWQEWRPAGSDTTSGTSATTSRTVDRGDAPAADGSVEQVAAAVLPSVVKIDVTGPEGAGSGSGIVLSSDGEILTNQHVVEVAADGGRLSVSFEDGTRAPAEVIGADPLTDTAVIKAENVSGLVPATIGTSANLDVGQDVVAIGSPFGLDATVTSGIVSALDRPVSVGLDAEGNSTTYPAVQTDAAINPGNSGGPLVDRSGDVVGVNSSIRSGGSSESGAGGSIGLGFAIPIDEVMPIVDQILAGETPTHARLGISVSDVANAEDPGAGGAVIQEVADGSIADSAGLATENVITRIDDTQITGADSLVATIRSYRPGDSVTVTYLRDDESETTTVELESDAD